MYSRLLRPLTEAHSRSRFISFQTSMAPIVPG